MEVGPSNSTSIKEVIGHASTGCGEDHFIFMIRFPIFPTPPTPLPPPSVELLFGSTFLHEQNSENIRMIVKYFSFKKYINNDIVVSDKHINQQS